MDSLVIVVGTVAILASLLIVRYYRGEINRVKALLEKRQTGAYNIGASQVRGDITQLIGSFALFAQYEITAFLSTSSKQASIDLIGVSSDSIDFIEIKKKGTPLQNGERKIRKLVEEKKVNYRIVDIELPDGIQITERPNGRRTLTDSNPKPITPV